jgi:ABC-type antimicrobial peptide transport system permease subunit
LFIALAGGVLGCLLGSLCHGWSATSIVSSGGPGKTVAFKMVVDLWVLAVGLAYSTVMGFGGGLLPAFTATRLRPLDALR